MSAPDPSSVLLEGPWNHRSVSAHGIRLHVAVAGEDSGDGRPPVLLVHGYAGMWWSWRHQLTALADAGHLVYAVDLRGYGDSDKPPRGYDAWTLAGDLAGLIHALGHSSAVVVGHGDGGTVAWTLATAQPHLVDRLVVISAPHPRDLRRAALRSARVLRAIVGPLLVQQLPRVPERLLSRPGGIESLLRRRTAPEWHDTPDFTESVRVFSSAIRILGVAHLANEPRRWLFRSRFRPDGVRYMRAMRRHPAMPILRLRGADDPYLPVEAHAGRRRPNESGIIGIPGAGHLPHMEKPTEVSTLLVDFLR